MGLRLEPVRGPWPGVFRRRPDGKPGRLLASGKTAAGGLRRGGLHPRVGRPPLASRLCRCAVAVLEPEQRRVLRGDRCQRRDRQPRPAERLRPQPSQLRPAGTRRQDAVPGRGRRRTRRRPQAWPVLGNFPRRCGLAPRIRAGPTPCSCATSATASAPAGDLLAQPAQHGRAMERHAGKSDRRAPGSQRGPLPGMGAQSGRRGSGTHPVQPLVRRNRVRRGTARRAGPRSALGHGGCPRRGCRTPRLPHLAVGFHRPRPQPMASARA